MLFVVFIEFEEGSDFEEDDDEFDKFGKNLLKRKLDSEVIEGDDDVGFSILLKRQKFESLEVEEMVNMSQSL